MSSNSTGPTCPKCGAPMKQRMETEEVGPSDAVQSFAVDYCPECERRDTAQAKLEES